MCIGIFHEVRAHVIVPMKLHYRIPTGSVPTGYNPMNQTDMKGKIPQDSNPIEFL
jgi:hypothetical protein